MMSCVSLGLHPCGFVSPFVYSKYWFEICFRDFIGFLFDPRLEAQLDKKDIAAKRRIWIQTLGIRNGDPTPSPEEDTQQASQNEKSDINNKAEKRPDAVDAEHSPGPHEEEVEDTRNPNDL